MSGGRAFTRDVEDGWFGRAEWAIYTGYTKGAGGPFLTIGGEGWVAEEAWGFSVPYFGNYALEAGVFFVSCGIGFDLFLFDRVYEESGWGVFALNAALNLGLNFDGLRILVDGRGKYRWQFSAEDRAQALAGLLLEIPL